MTWNLIYAESASNDLKKLDKYVAKIIVVKSQTAIEVKKILMLI